MNIIEWCAQQVGDTEVKLISVFLLAFGLYAWIKLSSKEPNQ